MMRKRAELPSENERSSLIETDESTFQIKEEMKDAPQIWSWKGEGKNIALLFFLYLLQGIPLGLTASIPLMLQNRHVSYKDQAEFSLVFWPFSLKLLWAPIVDSLYSSKMGRRKTWVNSKLNITVSALTVSCIFVIILEQLVPVQYLLGIAMLFLSTKVDQYLDSEGSPNIKVLTIGFFSLNFLAATQDIAVDGWALTMLHRYSKDWS
jgi:PAT family acetyl-CoA transporter-like MFS transporter 1